MQTDDGVHSASVVAVWEGGWRCRVSAAGFDLIVDEPPEAGGTGTGPMPTEYLLAALASCYALALNWAAGKRGVSLPDLAVTATGVYDGPRFGALQFLVATSAPADVVSPLIQPALRVCYVSNTIATSPPIEVVIAGEPRTPRKPGTPGKPRTPGAPGAPGTGDAAGPGDAPGPGDAAGPGDAPGPGDGAGPGDAPGPGDGAGPGDAAGRGDAARPGDGVGAAGDQAPPA